MEPLVLVFAKEKYLFCFQLSQKVEPLVCILKNSIILFSALPEGGATGSGDPEEGAENHGLVTEPSQKLQWGGKYRISTYSIQGLPPWPSRQTN